MGLGPPPITGARVSEGRPRTPQGSRNTPDAIAQP